MMISARTAGSEGTLGRITAVLGGCQKPKSVVEVVTRNGVVAANTNGSLLPALRAHRLALNPVPTNSDPEYTCVPTGMGAVGAVAGFPYLTRVGSSGSTL